MEYLIEDCGVFTPDDYMYIDDYEHPVDYIHRIYHETLRRIHLMDLDKKSHVEREVDVQIYPDTCICCRNCRETPEEIEIASKLCKKSETQHFNKLKNQTQFNTTEFNTTKFIIQNNSNGTKFNPVKLTTAKSIATEPTRSDTTCCITTKLNTITINSTNPTSKIEYSKIQPDRI